MSDMLLLSKTVKMLPVDMENFLALIECNGVEAEFDTQKAVDYHITITKVTKE